MRIAKSLGVFSCEQDVLRDIDQRRDRCTKKGNFNPGAFASSLTREKCRRDRSKRVMRSEHIRKRDAYFHRIAITFAGDGHQS